MGRGRPWADSHPGAGGRPIGGRRPAGRRPFGGGTTRRQATTYRNLAGTAGTTTAVGAVVRGLAALLAAVALSASGLLPPGLSVGAVATLLLAGGVLLALAALFVRYFADAGRLF